MTKFSYNKKIYKRNQVNTTFVYAVQAISSRLVKIGITSNPKRRIKEISNGCGQMLDTIMVIPGDSELERKLLNQFAEFRQEGEWFLPDELLLAYLESLRIEEDSPSILLGEDNV